MPETSRQENTGERTPGEVAISAVETLESREGGQFWDIKQGFKNVGKETLWTAGAAGTLLGVGLFAAYKIARGLLGLAKDTLTGKKLSFGEGYERGQKIFESKKEK